MVASHITKFCHVLSGELRGPLRAAGSCRINQRTHKVTLGRQEEERAHTCASVACAKQDFLVLQLPPLIGKAARENSLSLSPLPSFSVSLPPAPPSRISVLSSGISHGPTPSLPSSLSNATRVGLTIIHPNRNDLKPQTDNRSAEEQCILPVK